MTKIALLIDKNPFTEIDGSILGYLKSISAMATILRTILLELFLLKIYVIP